MSNKYNESKRHRTQIFYSSLFHATFVLIFVMAFWLGMPISAHAVNAVSFDGDDDFLVFSFNEPQTFEALTLMVWWQPGTFNPDKEADAALIRGTNQYPPKGGYIKTSYSKFSLRPNKDNWRQVGFQISTDDGDWEIWSGSDFYLADSERWYHIAVTYDSTVPDGDNVFLYLDGAEAASGRATGAITDVLSMWFGRLVHAIPGAIGETAGYSEALSQTAIRDSMDCGPVSDDSRIFYWPLNEGSGNAVTDPESGLTLYFGDAGDNTKYEPVWIDADYHLDTDGDGYADACDNCPSIPNNQADQDGDGAGNECDLCSNDGPHDTGSGDECSFANLDADIDVIGLLPTVTFNWGIPGSPAPDAYMVPQDCDNTVFECWNPDTGEVFTPNCVRPRSYMVTVAQDGNGESVNIPAGDLVFYEDGNYTTIRCDLLSRFPLEAFADGAVCRAIHTASTFDRDYDWVTGRCLREPCIEPNDDFPFGQEFRGIVRSNTFMIAPTSSWLVNIKHSSFPNSINLSGGGVITVGIYTAGDFDARTVDPSTVRLLDRLSGSYSDPPVKSEIRDLSDTLCGDPADIGACNPDSRPDLLLHFAETGMPFTHDLQVEVTGQTNGTATNFMGFDNLIIR